MTADVRPCGFDDVPALGASLAKAFRDDPIFQYLVPDVDDDERARRVTPLFRSTVRLHRQLGEAWTTPEANAGALWLPPGRKVPKWRELPAGVGFARASWRSIPRGMRLLAAMEKEHPREPHHWYLAVLGTTPEQQGKGLGSALVAPVLERCDREGLPAYLESSKESNIAYYERFGFKTMKELRIEPGGPVLWPMWREPA